SERASVARTEPCRSRAPRPVSAPSDPTRPGDSPMKFSAPPLPLRPHALVAALGMFAALALGACSRATHITDAMTAPARDGADATAAKAFGKAKTPPAVPTDRKEHT